MFRAREVVEHEDFWRPAGKNLAEKHQAYLRKKCIETKTQGKSGEERWKVNFVYDDWSDLTRGCILRLRRSEQDAGCKG
jgi:hypothetical protein